ncbi:hypothetical protein Fmac_020218 [Flemingia macrophylla]|uniref:Ankyrin repeat and zinc finger domain-containing protein 1 n=1 Tax=Flemingia macrophylla TaxID=520843 RepID=A0ABD1LTE4_9FABA
MKLRRKTPKFAKNIGLTIVHQSYMFESLFELQLNTKYLSRLSELRSVFEVPPNFFDSCRLLSSRVSEHHNAAQTFKPSSNDVVLLDAPQNEWTCNTCKTQFDSLQDQRSHFKSDIHRFNLKLTVAGKNIVKEEDFEVLTSEFVKDYDVSSISGSESDNDSEVESQNQNAVRDKSSDSFIKQKLFFCLQTGQRVSVWKFLIMNVTENVLYENEKAENELVEKLKSLSVEPRDNTHLRIVLLASGGHFAGCVFDGDAVVAHKTFHRYVVRAKAGKKQSSKDASGRAAHSAGASLRRYNELALKKEVQELLTAWKPYFDASKCIFIHAPSSSRQLFYDGERSYFTNQQSAIRNIALTVRRPTLREAKRVYSHLTQVTYEADEKEVLQSNQEDLVSINISKINGIPISSKGDMAELDDKDKAEACLSKQNDDLPISSNGESENELFGKSTPLHQAAQSSDSLKVLELLEQGLDPCIKDERGRTPYMLANDKEVRNTFRRFMAANLDKWDWHAAKVPSALTKEMEESQAAKQAEKDAKRKARAKELKKLRKAKEKKAQVEAALPKNDSKTVEKQATAPASIRGQSQFKSGVSKEEEIRMSQAAEREKRAAAAERRMASLKIQANSATTAPNMSEPKSGLAGDIYCSCCNSSLAGKVPFHRYNYKYCSTSCMHVHSVFGFSSSAFDRILGRVSHAPLEVDPYNDTPTLKLETEGRDKSYRLENLLGCRDREVFIARRWVPHGMAHETRGSRLIGSRLSKALGREGLGQCGSLGQGCRLARAFGLGRGGLDQRCGRGKKGSSPVTRLAGIDIDVSEIQNVNIYSYKDLRIATEGFSPANKIGQGGFGAVYKGKLRDGSLVAIKVLSADSRQGIREFLTEIKVISSIEHENLVKLEGCCVEGNHRILVYGYLENNSLAQTLIGARHSSIQLSWHVRRNICIGVARGLAFLHEEVRPHIIHRDIKASNVLLDKDLQPKISDFGLAKLIPPNLTHISTHVAGTAGYLAPEYAIRNQVTRKSDVYSFGVLLLEIVSGRPNTNRRLPVQDQYLLTRAWDLYESGEAEKLVDAFLDGDFNIEEAVRFCKIGLLCTQDSPHLRPCMSTVLDLLLGKKDVNEENVTKPGLIFEFVEAKSVGKQKSNPEGDGASLLAEGKQEESSSSGTVSSFATMTFTAIYDRSN